MLKEADAVKKFLPGDVVVHCGYTYIFKTDTQGNSEHSGIINDGDAGIFIHLREGMKYALVLMNSARLGFLLFNGLEHASNR